MEKRPFTRALVIGGGSIGERHQQVLGKLGLEVYQLSLHKPATDKNSHDLSVAINRGRPEYVVIANSTDLHHQTLVAVRRLFSGVVLVEKPLYQDLVPAAVPFENVFVGYNLRFHPGLLHLREQLRGQRVVSANAYVGSFLPGWRPDRDYRKGYSAKKAAGGGALRDLSHELDYLTWILGRADSVSALGGHFSKLEIDSDDSFTLIMTSRQCPKTTLELNYLDRLGQRYLTVVTDSDTWRLDFITGELRNSQGSKVFVSERNDSYEAMHRDVLSPKPSIACRYSEGLEVLELICAAEKSSREKKGVSR